LKMHSHNLFRILGTAVEFCILKSFFWEPMPCRIGHNFLRALLWTGTFDCTWLQSGLLLKENEISGASSWTLKHRAKRNSWFVTRFGMDPTRVRTELSR
jgi:hypothetical protein